MVAHVAKDGLDAQDCFCWLDELSLRFGRMLAPEADIDYFRRSQNPLASLLLLVIFVCVIPIVMLNALIAIMVSDI